MHNAFEKTPDSTSIASEWLPHKEARLTRGMIGIEPRADEWFEGSVAVQLSGFQPKAPNRGNALFDAAILEHLLAVPEADERIEFRYHWQPDSFSPELTLRIRGVAGSTNRTCTALKALRLYDRVSSALGSRRDCRFTVVAPQSGTTPRHHARVRFPGLLVSLQQRAVGLPPDSGFSSILLPSLSFTEARISFWRVLASCPIGLDVVVAIEPAMIGAPAIQALASAIQWLRNHRGEIMVWPEHRRLHVEELDLWRVYLERTMRQWLHVPRGLRFDVAFETAQAVPDATLMLLARSLFQGRLVEIDRPDTQGKAPCTPPSTLVLADCLHEAAAYPQLLPVAGSLVEVPLPQHYPEPIEALPESGLILGSVSGHQVRLPDNDRNRHLYVIGATGCGKSTVLLDLIRQDMEAGHGVCVIDPHGDLFAACLAAVPAHRSHQVVMMDVGDHDRAAGLNLLEAGGPHAAIQRSFIANEMIKIFDRLYDLRTTGGPMFEQYARAALGLLMDSEIPGLTLCEVPTVFEDAEIRANLIARCTSETVKRFWRHQAQRANGESSLENMAPYITSKFNQFTHNALIRPIIGQSRSTISFRKLMDSRGILLVNLPKGLLGEMDSSLLGMLIIGKIFSAALSRTELPLSERTPFALYVDEFQNFATETMGMLLAESRKYGVRLTLANQSLAQIDAGIRGGSIASTVLANVGTMMAMRLGNVDAERFEALFSPQLSAEDMVYLPDYHAAVRLLHAGQPMRPFVLRTTPSRPVSAFEANQVERIVRENYRRHQSRALADIENEIQERHLSLEQDQHDGRPALK